MNYIEMGIQAGLCDEEGRDDNSIIIEDHLKRFAKLVAAQEAEGDIRALKHRIHELEGELIGYKKIVADQDALLERQTARIVDLQTHIKNLEGEE